MTKYLITFDPNILPAERTIEGDGFIIENGWLFVFAIWFKLF